MYEIPQIFLKFLMYSVPQRMCVTIPVLIAEHLGH